MNKYNWKIFISCVWTKLINLIKGIYDLTLYLLTKLCLMYIIIMKQRFLIDKQTLKNEATPNTSLRIV